MYKILALLVPPSEFPEWRTLSRKISLTRIPVVGEKIDFTTDTRERTEDWFFYPPYQVTDVVHKASPHWDDPVAVISCLWHDFGTPKGEELCQNYKKQGWKLDKTG